MKDGPGTVFREVNRLEGLPDQLLVEMFRTKEALPFLMQNEPETREFLSVLGLKEGKIGEKI